ncbi:MAG: BamA/TamA family outer membrane protein [Ignavibacteriales bacterium]|nr:BamA/TamA family outer membrane protein [Ignavibacteriales bacterium]
MKNSLRILSIGFVLTFALIFVSAQAKKNEPVNDERYEELGTRVGNEIEKLVNRLARVISRYDVDEGFFDDDTLSSKRKRRTVSTDLESESNTFTYEGDKTVNESETVDGNIVVKGGDLTVFGKIDGDVLVVGGTLFVKDGGRITGNARIISGDVIREDGGKIDGYVDKTRSTTAGYREDRKKFTQPSTRFDPPWLMESHALENFIFRYNRVEGLFLGLGSEKRYYWDGRKKFNSFGSIGWGLKSHTWRYNLGVARQFPLRNSDGDELLEIGVEGYNLTDSKDQWIIGVHENTAAALLIHEDFRDYFERRGYSAHVGYYTRQDYINGEFKVALLADRYESMANRAEWALFGGEKVFRVNPAIDAGVMRSVLTAVGFSTVSKTMFGQEGWNILGSMEFTDKNLGGDFHFGQYIVDFRRYQPVSTYDNFNIRVRAGTAEGTLPPQKRFEIGGLSTLHAFPFKSEVGNRMLLMNAEYILNGDFLNDIEFWPSWLMRRINIILMTDAGLTREAPSTASWNEGFKGITWSEFKTDIGVGVANRSGSFKIAVVWRTDVKEPARFIFRFNRPF